MIAGSRITIVLLFICLALLLALLRRRQNGAVKPPEPWGDGSPKRTAVLSSAQKTTGPGQFDFLPFFRLEYPEEPDPLNAQQRHWAQAAIALLQQQDAVVLPQVMDYAQRLKDEYPHFYFGYYAVALVRQRQGDFDAACGELEAGIPLCRQKYTLYAALGSLLYDHDDFNPALGWWIRSVVSQASARAAGLSVPFVLLGYVARYSNLAKIADALFTVARQVDNKPPLLNEPAQEKLKHRLKEKGADTVDQALILLYTEHIPLLLSETT